MPHLRTWTTRAHLLLLVLVAVLPALLLLLGSGLEREREASRRATSSLAFQVQEAARAQEQLVDSAHQVLATLATLTRIQQREADRCKPLLKRLHALNPRITVLLAADPQGQVYAASVDGPPISIADRRYFQQALWNRRLASGEYVVGRLSIRPGLHLALPVIDAEGRIQGVVVAGLDLSGQGDAGLRPGLPAGIRMSHLDRNGVVIHDQGHAPSRVGQPTDFEAFRRMTGPRVDGTFEARDEQGGRRIVAYRQIRIPGEEDPCLVLRIDQLKSVALGPARRILIRDLALLALAAVLAGAVAWWQGHRILTGPLARLAAAADGIAQGEQPPSGPGQGAREVLRLERSVHDMARALSEQAERFRAQEEHHRLVLERAPFGILRLDEEGWPVEANPALLHILRIDGTRLREVNLEQIPGTPQLRDALAAAQGGGAGLFDGTLDLGGGPAEIRLMAYGIASGTGLPHGRICLVEDVAERRGAARALREREELLEAFFAQSLDGFYIALCDEPVRWDATVDKEAALNYMIDRTRITRINRAMLEMYGLPEQEIVGRPLRTFHEHDFDQAVEDFRNLLDQGRRHTETDERRADGSQAWFEGDYIVLYDAEGRVRGHFGIQRDITERKRWEETLRLGEERVRTLFDSLNDAIFLHDPHSGAILQVNRRAEELYGYSAEEFRNLDVQAMSSGAPPYSQAEVLSWMRLATAEGPQLFEWRAKDRTGRIFWVEVSMRPVVLEGEARLLVTARDITERKRTEAQLLEREQLFRLLFDRSPDPNLLLDGHHFMDCNPATVAFLRAENRSQILGTHPWDLSPEHQPDGRRSQEKAADMIARAHRKGSQRFEWVHHRFDGTEVPVEVLLTAIPWQGKWILHTAFRDLTERRQAEEARRALEAQVLQSQKLESLGVLAGGIAHDFNNLLAAILGNLNLAQTSLEEGTPAAGYLASAERTVLKASDLTKQMLAYSGRGRFMVKRLDLNHLVTDMANLLQVSIPKKVILESRLAPDLPALEGDAAQLQQVVLNLVTNAAEAIGDATGRIILSTATLHLEAPDLAALAPPQDLPAGSYLRLEVADDGCGIPPEVQARIFDPFFTTKRTGRGLGLSAMLGILKAHRGGVALQSTPGQGSTFQIYLPICEGPADLETPPQVEPLESPTGRVLLVDDEPMILEAGAALLERLGFQVHTARDGQEAVEFLEAHPASLDLVLMDLTMPRLDGREAFQRLRGLEPDLRVILSSGYDEGDSLRELSQQGLTGFLQKPYRLKELSAALRAALKAPSPDGETPPPATA